MDAAGLPLVPYDAPFRPYTDDLRDEVLAVADDLGETGMGRRTDGFDWDDVFSRIETSRRIDLGSDTDHPIFAAIKRATRKAWAETNG